MYTFLFHWGNSWKLIKARQEQMHEQKCLVIIAQNQKLEWYASNLIISKQNE